MATAVTSSIETKKVKAKPVVKKTRKRKFLVSWWGSFSPSG